jgi:hypothetical protein
MLFSTPAIPIVAWLSLHVAAGLLLNLPIRSRSFALPAILVPTAVSFCTIQFLNFAVGLPELWGLITLISFVHFTSLLYIKRWIFGRSETCQRCRGSSDASWLFQTHWICLYKVVSSPRFVGIPYKHVEIPSPMSPAKSTAIHQNFTMRRACWLPVKIGVLCAFNNIVTSWSLGTITADDFAPARVPLIRLLYSADGHHLIDLGTTRMMIIRIWVTVTGIYTPILVLDSIHIGLAVICIYILRIDTPDEWPDLFGSLWEAYSLSRFWSRYMASLTVKPLADMVKDSGIAFISAATAISSV